MKPHKWAKEIKAWADGETIQYKANTKSDWQDDPKPVWSIHVGAFRVKPAKVYLKEIHIHKHLKDDYHFLSPKLEVPACEYLGTIKVENRHEIN